MNTILASVRILQLITHLMMMKLNYPNSSLAFFVILFEFVNFELIPVDSVYENGFDLEDDKPFNSQAEEVGYESLFIFVS